MLEKGEVFLFHRTQTDDPKELDAEQSKEMFIYSWNPFQSEKEKDELSKQITWKISPRVLKLFKT